MEHGPMREVTLLVVALAIGVAPFAALIALLNLRDRRCAGLLARASAAFSGEALRSDVAVRVECRLFTPRSVVTVDMRVWSSDAVWDDRDAAQAGAARLGAVADRRDAGARAQDPADRRVRGAGAAARPPGGLREPGRYSPASAAVRLR